MKLTTKVKTNFDPANVAKQAKFAMAKTLTQLAYQAQGRIKGEMIARFDKPTPYTLNSLFVQPAKRDKLVSKVGLKNMMQAKSAGPAAETIGHQFVGGARKFKRSEGAFRRIGMMRDGEIIVPGASAELDVFGNIKRGFMIKLIAYFQAFGEQGYKANTTAKRRKSLAKVGRSEGGYKTINGVSYFFSPGKGRADGKTNHLARGIWQRKGIHGVDVSPVLLFVKAQPYRQRVDIGPIGVEVYNSAMPAMFRKNFEQAMASAR